MDLYDKLVDYSQSDVYPFHMPGHKRQVGNPFLQEFPNPYAIDITEIDGFDNLHHAEGIIRESMDRAAKMYGADRSYYLVNGSSCGILSAVCGMTQHGGKILMSRNCHKAAYHGVFLNRLRVEYIYPQIIEEFGIQGGLVPEDVEQVLKTDHDIQAVLVVSPTYDGIVSDVEKIVEICHGCGIPLIVDEAHGAHFRFSEFFPNSAVDEGADLVIQSMHKTLPALTQTALLHRCSDRVERDRLQRFMGIYQSSSPSYLLMASIDWCVGFLAEEAALYWEAYVQLLKSTRADLKKLKNIRLVGEELIGKKNVKDVDLSKLLFCLPEGIGNGHWLNHKLREDYHLEMEMEAERYVLGISSVCDSQNGMRRLIKAMGEIDAQVPSEKRREWEKRFVIDKEDMPVQKITIAEALEKSTKKVLLNQSEGEISAEFVYLYPPGIPLLTPGEKISKSLLRALDRYRKQGIEIQGLADLEGKWIKTVV